MGMYDDIKYEMDCPKCGAKVTGFQSKDGPCCFATLEFWEVDNFYSHCGECGTWIEFTLKVEVPRPKFSLEDYKMEVSEMKVSEK